MLVKLSVAKTLKRRNMRAFTLLELLIAAGIASIILTIGIVAITTTISAQNESSARIRAAENARLFFQMLERDLRAAYPAGQVLHKYVSGNPEFGLVQDNGAYDQSHLFHCFSRIDQLDSAAIANAEASLQDEHFFVMYFVNDKKQLCRQTTNSRSDPNGTLLTAVPAADLSSDDHALFEDVYALKFQYRYWNTLTKQFEPDITSPAGANDAQKPLCTHLQVTLLINDQISQKKFQEAKTFYLHNAGADANAEQIRSSLYRTFTKIIPIPETFDQ